ncbi:MAG: type II secretion system protein GspG [Planctomycetes bacterium]|nr:type II secretion system protein GspG [Planctomycetota bacterium]
MVPRSPNSSGMTLVELVASFAVVLLLAGIVVPTVKARIEAARIERAERDITVLGSAVRDFWRANGVWPCRDGAGNADGLDVLVTGATVPTSNPWSSSTDWWSRVSGRSDVLWNHLGRNTPGGSSSAPYPSSRSQGWRGPFLDATPLDPWGRPYVVLVGAGHASPSGSDPVHLVVLSAGSDGEITTPIQLTTSATSTGVIAAGDVGLLVWRRT